MEKLFVQIYTQLNELNENVIQPAYRLKEIAQSTEGKLIEQHLALIEACLGAIIRQLKALSEADDTWELLDRQATLAASWRDELVALAQTAQRTPEQTAC
ncbi:MAG: phasin family protein [Gammaproteobacteria bacterium]